MAEEAFDGLPSDVSDVLEPCRPDKTWDSAGPFLVPTQQPTPLQTSPKLKHASTHSRNVLQS